MLDAKREIADALARAMSDALTNGFTTDDINEIAQMVAAQQPRTLDELAQRMGEEAGDNDALPIYTEPPPGAIDMATAVREHGVNYQTAQGWIRRGVLPVLGRLRGRGGLRSLVCEETVARLAKMPKNKGGRPRKTSGELRRYMNKPSENEEVVYQQAPQGMIDLATAQREYGVNVQTAHTWIRQGDLSVLGRVRGTSGARILVSEESIARMANSVKKKGG